MVFAIGLLAGPRAGRAILAGDGPHAQGARVVTARQRRRLQHFRPSIDRIAAEVEILNNAVRKAAAGRLTFDDEPAAFASLMSREAK